MSIELKKGTLAVCLSLAILVSGLGAGDRRGANILITDRDSKLLQGELLAVRGGNLTILSQSTSAEITMSLADIQHIRIIKGKPKPAGGAVIGAVLGLVAGIVAYPNSEPDPTKDRPTKSTAAAYGAIAGATIGYLIAGVTSEDKNMPVGKTDPEHIAKLAERLKKYARDPS